MSIHSQIKKYRAPLFLLLLSIVFFRNFFFKKLIPIPADITVGLYYPWLNYHWGNATTVPVKNPLISDVVSIIYQWRIFAIDSVKQGHFPWWNPNYFFGMPLFANFQNSLINLTNLVFFLPFKLPTAWGLMIYLQIPFSLFCAYYYLRTLRFNTLSAIAGSIVSSFSLFSLVWLEYGVHVYTASFLPLLLAFMERYRLTQKSKYLSCFSLSLALQIYGGYPQYVIYSLLICVLVFFITSSTLDLKKTLLFCMSICLGLGLSLPLLIPGAELLQRSIHDIDTTASSSNHGFLPFSNVLTAISPNFWGNPATYDYYGQGFYDNNAFFPGTIAIIAFVFSITSIILHRRSVSKLQIFFTILIPLVFFLSVQNPISEFFKNNSGLLLGKNGLSTRLFLFSNIGFTYLTASLFSYISHNTVKKKLMIVFCGFFTVFWTLAILSFTTHSPANLSAIGFKNTLYAFVFQLILLPMLSITLLVTNKIYTSAILFCLILLSFSELSYYGLKYLPFSESRYIFPSTPSLSFLSKNTDQYRIATADTIPENMWMPYGLKTPDGYDTLVPTINYQLLSLIQDGYFATSATRAKKLSNFNSPIFDLTAVKYILKQNPHPQQLPTEFSQSNFKLVSQDGLVSIVENLKVRPRASFSSNIISTNSHQLSPTLANNLINQNTTIFTDQVLNLSNLNSCQDDTASVEITTDNPNQITIKTNNKCPGLLTLKDAYYPGWQATIDGIATPIYQSDIAFRSVMTTPGSHIIKFNYLPSHFYLTLIISLISLLLTIIIFFIFR